MLEKIPGFESLYGILHSKWIRKARKETSDVLGSATIGALFGHILQTYGWYAHPFLAAAAIGLGSYSKSRDKK